MSWKNFHMSLTFKNYSVNAGSFYCTSHVGPCTKLKPPNCHLAELNQSKQAYLSAAKRNTLTKTARYS
jgi:hypothetical protein